uniref:Leucine-rich repeat-containing N-terminal plant-type domain-containing protein n=1 Tax=Aegilops tauschii TaxID=37682 RepID=M8CPT6_AEGTA
MAPAAALLLAAAVVVALACLALADPPASEQSALLSFLAAVPHERKLGWSASTPACAWVGVTCDAANSTVVKLRLPGIGLVGPIPPGTLGRLKNLQVLSLRANRVSGTIPDELLRLSGLRAVFLQDNAISGAIPPGVSGLAALERLALH